LMEDDIYEGMFIPKGTLVFANIWWVLPLQFTIHLLTFWR
jgi:hypothetical protein